jgi:hypothetical protein
MTAGDVANFIKWLVVTWKGDLKLKAALKILGWGVLLIAGGFTLNIDYDKFSFTWDNGAGIFALLFGGILTLVGVYFVYKRFKELEANPPYLLYLRGIENMDTRPPKAALPASDRSAREMVFELDSYDKDSVLQEYGLMQSLISKRIENGNASHLYVAGLGSFPMQYLLGTLIRNAYSVITYLLDFDRIKNRWYVLEDFNTKGERPSHIYNGEPLDIDSAVKKVLADDPSEVGIALAYTFDIPEEQLPPTVREHTIVLKLSCGGGHDLISSTAVQRTLLNDISRLLRAMGSNGRKVHFFAAAQSSFCIALGKSYMDNAHGTVVLHNYNHRIEGYDWSVEFYRGKVF